MITNDDYLSLAPIFGISLLYWLRDRYLYNRADGGWRQFSHTQLYVLAFAYPSWIFLTWTLGMQTSRSQVGAAFITTTGLNVVGHYTVIGILNDSFRMTRQQFVGLLLGLLIQYTWTGFYLIIVQTSQNNCVTP